MSAAGGLFLSLDGLDGSGKTTQIERLVAWLRGTGRTVVTCRDPGTTTVGEQIRGLLLSRETVQLARRSEMLLYMAARAQLVDEVIRPALASGQTVVSDRFLLANVVYQGHGGGLDPAEIWRVGEAATAGVMPELTVVLDVPPAGATARLARELDRMELQGEVFRARVRAGYLAEAARQPERIVVVDGTRAIDEVERAVRELVETRVLSGGRGRG